MILCYKLNGEWLDPERGGPVRIVVPEAYGFKSIKWLTHVVLTNLCHANDTYAEQNNDVDSPLKTFAATLSVPRRGEGRTSRSPVTGYAQVGISGLSKVQVWIESNAKPLPEDDPYFTTAPWVDATILPRAEDVGRTGGRKVPAGTLGFDESAPKAWPMRLQGPLGRGAARPAGGRIHLPLPHDRREGPRPADAAAVPEVGPRGDRIRGHPRS